MTKIFIEVKRVAKRVSRMSNGYCAPYYAPYTTVYCSDSYYNERLFTILKNDYKTFMCKKHKKEGMYAYQNIYKTPDEKSNYFTEEYIFEEQECDFDK